MLGSLYEFGTRCFGKRISGLVLRLYLEYTLTVVAASLIMRGLLRVVKINTYTKYSMSQFLLMIVLWGLYLLYSHWIQQSLPEQKTKWYMVNGLAYLGFMVSTAACYILFGTTPFGWLFRMTMFFGLLEPTVAPPRFRISLWFHLVSIVVIWIGLLPWKFQESKLYNFFEKSVVMMFSLPIKAVLWGGNKINAGLAWLLHLVWHPKPHGFKAPEIKISKAPRKDTPSRWSVGKLARSVAKGIPRIEGMLEDVITWPFRMVFKLFRRKKKHHYNDY